MMASLQCPPPCPDPVEELFDGIQASLDAAEPRLTESLNSLDAKRLASMVQQYVEERILKGNKRERDDEAEHRECCGGCSGDGTDSAKRSDGPTIASATDRRRDECQALLRSLERLRGALKKRVAFGSLAETIVPPQRNPSFDPDVPTVDVDAFLYDEDDVEELVEQNRLARSYCKQCKSTEIGDVQFISHSFSKDQLLYLFTYALPNALRESRSLRADPLPLQQLTLCDVGSRYGVVLAAAARVSLLRHQAPPPAVEADTAANADVSCYAFSSIVGVELNAALCTLQQSVLSSLLAGNTGLVKVHCLDAVSNEGLGLLRSADVVVLHNVFEWFHEEAKQLRVWEQIRSALCKPGQIIVAVPTFEESLHHLAHHFGTKHSETASAVGLTSVQAVDEMIGKWVKKINLSETVQQFAEERLSGRGGDDNDDDDVAAVRDEVIELISQINVYLVVG